MSLGLIQGVTEFLPISSSAHLLLVPYLLGWPDQGLAVDAMLHAGTLASLLAYFRRDISRILTERRGRRLAAIVGAATIPGAAIGLVAGEVVAESLRWPVFVALWSSAWAVVMAVADRRAHRWRFSSDDALDRVTWRQGLGIGLAQSLALIPGTSRSGITITAGLASGLDRATAARFAFLLGIPITAGAATAETARLLHVGVSPEAAGPLVAAFGAALISGWVAVWFLVSYLQRRSLIPFVIYRLGLGAAILAVTAGGPTSPAPTSARPATASIRTLESAAPVAGNTYWTLSERRASGASAARRYSDRNSRLSPGASVTGT
jgi:undecaprenyl-diphosphatase